MRRIYFLYFFIIISFCSYSQEDSTQNAFNHAYRFSHIGVGNGLSPGAVNAILKEENGFLWIATTSGLNRYDGYDFDNYSPKPSSTSAIQSSNFRDLFNDPLGNIWCVTQDGINIFDPESQTFTADQSTILKELQIPGKTIENIIKLSNEKYLLVHDNAQVSLYDANIKNINDLLDFNRLIAINDLEISSVVFSEENSLWVIYTSGLIHQLDILDFSIQSKYTLLSHEFLGEAHDFKMLQDKNGDFWIHLFRDYGVYKYDVKHNKLEHFNKNSKKLALSSNLISAIEEDSEGNIWIGSDRDRIRTELESPYL